MNSELEIIKDIFSHSSENVFILNYEFELIWYNKPDLLNFFSSINFRELLKSEKNVLESGEYFFTHNGLEFSGRIINYPQQQIYVLQMSGDDVMFSYIKSSSARAFFSNQAAQVRQAVTGIYLSGNMLRKALDKAGLYEEERFVDATAGNCYKLLKSVLNTTELIRYTEDTVNTVKINLTQALEEFVKICKDILKEQIEIILKTVPDLYIKADSDRFTACLLSLTVLTGKHNPGYNTIIIDADRVGESIAITVSAADGTEKKQERVFSKLEKLYDDDASDPDLFVVCRFCKTFGGTVYIAENPETGGKVYSVKLPSCNYDDKDPVCRSPLSAYEDKFSRYHIALSDIAEIY